ncbi:hypothetical protein COB57_00355 [Candidatus Peregrinibacteria bacterium]|nr:MAG: hypothetical protein COB57_00355 [Candidatus Peregrinibacteria bacterium]
MPEIYNPSSRLEAEKRFYSDIVRRYETEVNRFVPGYTEEIIPLVVGEVIKQAHNGAILDIGSGVGNIDEMIIDQGNPQSVDLVEISGPMIEESKKRLKEKNSTIRFHEMSAIEFSAKSESFEAILSNLVIHNIPVLEKEHLINNIYNWLKKGGIFIWTDLVNFSDSAELERCFEERKKIALTMGATVDFAEENFKKEREEDHMITVKQMIEMLKKANFQDIAILWTKYNEAIIRATK